MERARPRALPLLPAILAAACGVLLYARALGNPFVYDDYRLIVDNPALRDPWNLWAAIAHDMTRPLVALSYALDTALWGMVPFGYHLSSLLLHAFNVTLVHRLVALAMQDRSRQPGQVAALPAGPSIAAAAAALLFAVHPMMTEAVGYVTGRSELLCGSLLLLSFLAGRRWMTGSGREWWLACVVAWLAALLAKESAAVLPFLLLAYGFMVLDGSPGMERRRVAAIGLPMAGLTLVAGIARLVVLFAFENAGSGADLRHALVAAKAVWLEAGLFAAPANQSIYHSVTLPAGEVPWPAVAGALALLALPLLAWPARRAHSLVAFGLLWFELLMLPSAALFALGIGEPLAERRGYVAAVGLFLAGASVFAFLWERCRGRIALRGALAVTSLLFVAQLSLQSMDRIAVWADPVLLAEEAVGLAPDDWIPRMLLAEAHRQAGDCDRAIPAFAYVLRLRPRESAAIARLRSCLLDRGRLDDAEDLMVQVKAADPSSADAALTLGILALLRNDGARARSFLLEVAQSAPGAEAAGHDPRVVASRLLAFLDASLAPADRDEVCAELRAMSPTFEGRGCAALPGAPGQG